MSSENTERLYQMAILNLAAIADRNYSAPESVIPGVTIESSRLDVNSLGHLESIKEAHAIFSSQHHLYNSTAKFWPKINQRISLTLQEMCSFCIAELEIRTGEPHKKWKRLPLELQKLVTDLIKEFITKGNVLVVKSSIAITIPRPKKPLLYPPATKDGLLSKFE